MTADNLAVIGLVVLFAALLMFIRAGSREAG
jgi:hypothetical protein